MAKGNPSLKSLRQGQTIYYVMLGPDWKYHVGRFRLTSDREHKPLEHGVRRHEVPLSMVRRNLIIRTFHREDIFYSRRRAASRAKLMNQMKQRTTV